MNDEIILEACIESIPQLLEASYYGIKRVELCYDLFMGGISPNPNFTKVAIEKGIAVVAMIRHYEGFELYSDDLPLLIADIQGQEQAGAEGVVFGYLTKDKELDIKALESLLAACKKTYAVFHMAFDEIPKERQFEALDTLSALGFRRVLTKGGLGPAEFNIEHLRKLNEYAAGKIEIICGGGVDLANYKRIAEATGIRQFHGRRLYV